MTTGGVGGSSPIGPIDCSAEECTLNHAATGWCSVATGDPVILLVQVDCRTPDEIAVITIDPATGDILPNGPVMPCGEKDWEVNQLCDVDPVTGVVIATVTQIFEWDQETGSLTITLERPDNPGVPYVPAGTLQTCSSGQLQAITQEVCANDAGNLRQIIEVVLVDTLDGTVRYTYYLDAEGNPVTFAIGETLSVGSCYEADIAESVSNVSDNTGAALPLLTSMDASLALLTGPLADCSGDPAYRVFVCGPVTVEGTVDVSGSTVIAEGPLLEAIESNTDGLEQGLSDVNAAITALSACCAATNVALADANATLVEIDNNTDGLEPALATVNANLVLIQGYVDGLEAALASIDGHVDGLEACCAAQSAILTEIDNNTDELETLATASNALLTAIGNNTDGLEAQLATITGHVDGIEALITASNVQLSAINSNTDGLEGLIGTTNANLTSIIGYVDGIEGLIGTSNTLLTAISGYVDGIEGLITAGNASLATIATNTTNTSNATALEDSAGVDGGRGMVVLGRRNDNDTTRTDTDGDYSHIATDAAGRVKTSSITTATPATTGGLSIYRNLDVNATGVNIKASAGQAYMIFAINRANAERFLKLYNKATAPTVGTDTPVMTFPLGGTSGNQQNSIVIPTDIGAAFSLGIGIGATTGIADANTSNPSANDIVAVVFYK